MQELCILVVLEKEFIRKNHGFSLIFPFNIIQIHAVLRNKQDGVVFNGYGFKIHQMSSMSLFNPYDVVKLCPVWHGHHMTFPFE